MNNTTKALVAALLASILSGGNSTFNKIGLSQIPVFSFIALRFIVGSLMILPLLRSRPIGKNAPIGSAIKVSLLSAANIVLFAYAMTRTTATIGQLVYVLVPTLTVVVSYIYLNERMSLQKVGGVILGLIGILYITFVPLLGTPDAFVGDALGNVLIVIGAVLFSMYGVFSKPLQKEFSPLQLTAIFYFTAVGVSIGIFVWELVTQFGWWSGVGLPAWGALLYMGTVANLPYVLWQYAIKKGSPTIASLSLYMTPVAAFLWASLLLGERLTGPLLGGAAIIFLGAWLTTRATK